MKRNRSRRSQVLHAVQHHPWLTAAAVVLISCLPSWLYAAGGLGIRYGFVYHAGMAVLAAILLTVLGWWGEAGLTGPSRWRNLHLAAIPLLAVVALFPGFGAVEGARFLPYAVLSLLMALQREAWFRGILFRTLVPSCGPRRTVGLTALLFALMQGADLLAGASAGNTLFKAMIAGLFGYVLGALRVRTRSIWPGAIVVSVFHLSWFLERLRVSGGMQPLASDRLSMQAFMALVVCGCAVRWMRKADEAPAPETETARAS